MFNFFAAAKCDGECELLLLSNADGGIKLCLWLAKLFPWKTCNDFLESRGVWMFWSRDVVDLFGYVFCNRFEDAYKKFRKQ